MKQWSKGSTFLELFKIQSCILSSYFYCIHTWCVSHDSEVSCRCLTWGTHGCFCFRVEFSAWRVVPDLNLTCRNSTRKGPLNMFLMEPRSAQYWAHLSHQNINIHVNYLCVVFSNLCGGYFLGSKHLTQIFHVFSMQRSCSPACLNLKYEQN